MTFDDLVTLPPYGVPQTEKSRILAETCGELHRHHYARSDAYRRAADVLHGAQQSFERIEDMPFLPVGLFKSHRLVSVPPEEIFKTMTSSGTTGQKPSEVFLDRETARRQTLALAKIFGNVLGPQRLPMILAESRATLANRARFSARTAGVLGMMNFGRDHFFALREDMSLDREGLDAFLDRHRGADVLIFGFTFMVWKYLLEPLRSHPADLARATLVHSGGWKKLESERVSNPEFREAWRKHTGLTRVFNFYGMVEQVGSVFLEASDGLLYAPLYADIIIRDPLTLHPAPVGTPGVIQTVSVLPLSYPGHSILTEDLGVVESIDSGTDGRLGKGFRVIGRIPRAEIRGCSDTHAQEVGA